MLEIGSSATGVYGARQSTMRRCGRLTVFLFVFPLRWRGGGERGNVNLIFHCTRQQHAMAFEHMVAETSHHVLFFTRLTLPA